MGREKIVKVSTVFDECCKARDNYDVFGILAKLKEELESGHEKPSSSKTTTSYTQILEQISTKDFGVLERDKQELLTLGLIKMGEALTFCRDRFNPYVGSDLCNYAHQFARVRNHLVHWQLYDSHRDPPSYDKLTNLIKDLPSESDFNSALNGLILCRDKTLSKPVGSGSNDFQFEFSHYLTALKGELTLLNENLAGLEDEQVVEKLKADKAFLANNENRVRNVLVILIDLMNENKCNKNFGTFDARHHNIVEGYNERFFGEDNDLMNLYHARNDHRNSLSHLDPTLEKPYENKREMMEFLRLIGTLHELRYVKQLSEKLESTQENQVTATTTTTSRTDNVSVSLTKRSSTNFDTLTERKRLKTSTEQPNQSLVDYSDSDSEDDEDKHSEEDTDKPSLRRGS